MAGTVGQSRVELPAPLEKEAAVLPRIREAMFRSEVLRHRGLDGDVDETLAFRELQKALIEAQDLQAQPSLAVVPDQVVWARSPARLDLAGGWSDTPPYCLQRGGRVVNLAVELNGQPPLQVFIRRSTRLSVVLRSIDNGVAETVDTYDQLDQTAVIGSAFSIPRAALALAGLHPRFHAKAPASLRELLGDLGGGLEISLLSAIPKGSGLGTSSILAATVLGALSRFFALGWTTEMIGHRTLVLEQLLTTGGGWQDQFGGLYPGVKLLETAPGLQDQMSVRWLPEAVFSAPEFRDQWLLYYTGMTRVAKTILGEIVKGMFLNEGRRLVVVDQIAKHAHDTAEAIQRRDFSAVARHVGRSWILNKRLDPGTSTPEIEALVHRFADRALGWKLLGAGGGGYLLIAAKDPQASREIRSLLETDPPNAQARFVHMAVSNDGYQCSMS